jgi:uncharacterized protein GlcG (DUF336 family)
MSELGLDRARAIVRGALEHARANGLPPVAVAVLDAGGHLKAFEREDGASIYRFQVAHGKAHGAVGMGLGSRALHRRAEEQSYFLLAVGALHGTAVVPVPGGVLVRDGGGAIIGAVGISGDKSDADEAAAVAGIEAAGLVADP